MYEYNGLSTGIGNLALLSNAESRSISAENFTGEKGKGGMAVEGTGACNAKGMGQGWKVSPFVFVEANTTFTLCDINDQGTIQHIWMTCDPGLWRSLILRIFWDNEEFPSVEVPIGDFFCNGWCEYSHVNSIPISVNPYGGLNCYWPMPFRKAAKITIENMGFGRAKLFFQIDYTLTAIPENAAYFHGQWRRSNPLKSMEVHPILDDVIGAGHFVGTYLAWQSNNNGWFGEGEVKFYIDGDKDFPTICGTGTEDYVGGAWSWEVDKQYQTYSTPYLGMHQVIKPDGLYRSKQRFGMYRWHILDPIRFKKDIKITIHALGGWREDWRYVPLQDNIASTAFWYQTEPHHPFETNLDKDHLEVI